MTQPYHPTSAEIVNLREGIQKKRVLGITAAQAHCAKVIHVTLRGWRFYETGERKMHPAFYELAKIKLKR